jgi:uncharacterized protein with HEPN domain
MKDDRVFLAHVRDAISKIESYTQGGRETFFADAKTQDAVIRNLEIIGEAVKNLSADLRAQHPEMPWARIAGGKCLVGVADHWRRNPDGNEFH